MPQTSEPKRIVICDDLDPAALDTFRAGGFEPEVLTGMDEDELCRIVPGVHALIVRSATHITRRVIECADHLAVIGRAGVGVDNVDTEAATEHGVVVMNTPTGNTTTTAELAIALLFSLARHIPRADRATRTGSWKKKHLTGTELTGKTLGVIGLGRIGSVVARRGLGLEMNVIAHDPYLQGSDSPIPGVELCDLDELLAQADFVTLHIPLTDATRNLLSRERLALMKPSARLVNAARGGLVDELALAEALDQGRLAGAALDVLSTEPPPPDHPLLGRDDVILTPHLGAASHEAQHKVAVDIARQVIDFLREGVAFNAINAPAVSPADLRELAPYILLAERMSSFLAQYCTEPVRKLELTFAGEIARGDTRPLELAVLVGALKHSMDTGVNFVNAPILAKERGLRLLGGTEEESAFFQSQLKLRATSKAGEETHICTGTVFGRKPRLVRIDDLHLDLEPRGAIIVTEHRDEPGVVGLLGTMLGGFAMNIRRIELGTPSRDGAKPGRAVGFIALEEAPSTEVLDALRGLDPVESVRLVRL